MATFGPIASAMPNVLYNPMAVDQAVQGRQRNQLMMDNARQDQAQQTFQRDATARIGMARELSALPEQEAASQWGSYRQRLQSAGLGQGLPEQFPGLERLKAVASSDLTTFQRMQIDEKRRASEALMGLIGGGGVPAAPAGMAPVQPAPAAAPGVPVSAPDGNMYGRNAGAAVARDALLDQPPVVLAAASSARAAQSGLPTNAPYRDGATWAAGIAPPTGAVPALAPASAPVARPAAAPAPAGPALLPNGLTQQQASQLAVIAQSNPQAALTQMGAYQQQNRMAQERAQDDVRQRQQREEDLEFRRGAETRAEAARREAAEAARLAAERAGVPAGYRRKPDGALEPIPGGPADKPADAQATEAERKASSYLERMQGAETMLETMQRDGYNPGNVRDRVAGATPIVGNFLTSEPGQRYLNAAAEWARAKLRLESGAVIGEEEARAEARTYFPMPGDSPQTIAQKKTLRDTATSAIRRQAGRAAPAGVQGPTPGSTAEPPATGRGGPAVGAVEDGYRFKGGNPSSPDSWERVQ